MKSNNFNLQKQIELLTATTTTNDNEPKSSDELQLQSAISEKNKAFLTLRNSFDDVITRKDEVINAFRDKINELRAEYLNISKENKQ